ncbi:MAG: HAMP domain-containing histidine kinase [Prolixibacteraceae bacterium]|nr:HAMP domain-containing histidine kinase [Prolixibacteraceae bacterium]
MFSGNNKYLFLLIVIIVLLPAALFALIELSRLQQNENVIEEAYTEQLNAILSSVELYSDDALTSTIREIDLSFHDNKKNLSDIIANNSYIKDFFLLENGLSDSVIDIQYKTLINDKAKQILSENDSLISRLKLFYRVPYYKAVPFTIEETGLVLFIFIVEKEGELLPAGLVVDARTFISQRLFPQIQKVAADKFNIVVFDNKNEILYNTSRDTSLSRIELTSPIESFSEFTLGIALEGETISDLVKNRTKTNIYFVVIVCVVLLVAGWLVIRIFRKQMELANLKSDFVSNVSHEIRTPLSLINMYAETIEMGRVESPELQKDYIRIILREINRLSIMVNKILNFSQIEKQKKSYEFSDNNLNRIALETFDNYIPYLEKLGFQHKTELDKRVKDQKLDTNAVKDVIVNLLDNAIKYSFEKKEVVLRTGIFVNMTYIEIEDSGIGISEKDKKNIFEKFYRVSNNDISLKVKGSGLGLSIVKHIVDAHHGKIEIKSKVGKGSIFRIYFPINN